MKILIVDDSKDSRLLIERYLKKGGHSDILTSESAADAFELLGLNSTKKAASDIDLILMDIVMPEMNGIEACSIIKKDESLKDIPIIMVTGITDNVNLQQAFEAGAIDYITKPINRVELLARAGALLRLKQEMDQRMEVTRQLEAANAKLKLLSSLDGLTNIANRRRFDEFLEREWRRALRDENHISLIMVDIDYFKKYNDGYGHQAGDDCLKKVAGALAKDVKRPGDLVARYGGEEFAVVLSNTEAATAKNIAEKLRSNIESMGVPHDHSEAGKVVTLSIGVASVVPSRDSSPGELIEAADKALYKAKHNGRNRVEVSAGSGK